MTKLFVQYDRSQSPSGDVSIISIPQMVSPIILQGNFVSWSILSRISFK